MGVEIEELHEVTDEVVAAFSRLIPQLSGTAPPPDARSLSLAASCEATTILLARCAGAIAGTLTLVLLPLPAGCRARIEDVVVDESARGLGAGEALVTEAVQLARRAGARKVDLTSRSSRTTAHRIYRRAGFEAREATAYRLVF